MRISQLIANLQRLQETEGDLEVFRHDSMAHWVHSPLTRLSVEQGRPGELTFGGVNNMVIHTDEQLPKACLSPAIVQLMREKPMQTILVL